MKKQSLDVGEPSTEPGHDPETGGGRSRRTVLKGLATGALLGPALFSGRGRADSPVPSRIADTFDTIVNVVEAGADDTGDESINDVLEDVRADDTLLYFPPGRYHMDRQFRFSGFDNFGLYGDDAVIVPADYHNITDDKHKLFRLGTHYAPGQRVVVENFTVDFAQPDTGVRVFEINAAKDLHVRHVTILGEHDSGMWGPGRFVVRDPDGEGIVAGFNARGGGEWSENTPSAGTLWRGPTGIICNDYNEGRIMFLNCHVGGFPDNGLYAGDTKGPVIVQGGLYKNSNGNNIRVGGPDAKVRGATVVVDETSPECNAHRGIRLQNTKDAVVADCDIRIDVPVSGSTGIKVMDGCYGHTLVRDTRIEMASDVFNNAVDVSPHAADFKALRTDVVQDTPGGSAFVLDGADDGEDWARLVDVAITGNPGHELNRSAIYNTRNNVEFRGVTVDQGGGSKRRALENFGDDCVLYQCDFRTNQYPVIDSGRKTWVSYNEFRAEGDEEGYYLKDESEDVYLKRNHIKNGVRNGGCDGLRKVGNSS